jgi:hypothetical protein
MKQGKWGYSARSGVERRRAAWSGVERRIASRAAAGATVTGGIVAACAHRLVGAQRYIRIAFGGRIILVGAPRFNRIALGGHIVLVGAPRFIRIALGGHIVLVGAPRFTDISFSGHIVLGGAPRYIRFAFGGRIVFFLAQLFIAYFVRIVFGGRIVFVGALFNHAGISLKIHKLPLNFGIHGAYRRSIRRIKHPEHINKIFTRGVFRSQNNSTGFVRCMKIHSTILPQDEEQ